MKKSITTFALLLTLSFVIVCLPKTSVDASSTELASIPKPSVPEFTVKFVDNSYDVPTTQSVDPYTGETVIHHSHRVENRTIEVTIKNQPFASKLMYNIRVKGHFSEYWIELYIPSDGFLIQSDSEYTVTSFTSTGGDDFDGSHSAAIHVPVGGQVDFQVEAMIGYVHRVYNPYGKSQLEMYPYVFTGETSGWSETQTITIPTSTSTTTPTPFPITWVVAKTAIIAIGAVAFLVYFRKLRKTTEKAE